MPAYSSQLWDAPAGVRQAVVLAALQEEESLSIGSSFTRCACTQGKIEGQGACFAKSRTETPLLHCSVTQAVIGLRTCRNLKGVLFQPICCSSNSTHCFADILD